MRRRGNIETGVGGERRAGNFAAVGCEHVYDDKYELEDEEKIESGRKSREVGYECDDEYYFPYNSYADTYRGCHGSPNIGYDSSNGFGGNYAICQISSSCEPSSTPSL